MELSAEQIKKVVENVRFLLSKEANDKIKNVVLVKQVFGVCHITAKRICDRSNLDQNAKTVNF